MNKKAQKSIPVTVITGFLGSGKTTLINRVLTEHHGIRFAVIENEFGEIGIDQELVLNEKEEIIEMNNGCICCTVRGDLIRIIKKLVSEPNPPEHILIETTGLADPAPVAQTFLTDPEIASATFLDGIVTLVDAFHIHSQLISTPEAKDQIAFADVILLNKTDLVSAEDLQKIEKRILEINKFAKILHSKNGMVDLNILFNIGGFDVERALTVNPKFMEVEYPFEYGALYILAEGSYTLKLSPNGNEQSIKVLCAEGPHEVTLESLNTIASLAAILFSGPARLVLPHGHLNLHLNGKPEIQCLSVPSLNTIFNLSVQKNGTYLLFSEHTPEEFGMTLMNTEGKSISPSVFTTFRPAHSHDEEVSSVGIEIAGSLNPQSFQYFIHEIVQLFGNELYRYKGVISIADEQKKIVLQGVHMLFEMQPSKSWGETEERKSSIVFIGKGLNRNLLTQGFLSCRETSASP